MASSAEPMLIEDVQFVEAADGQRLALTEVRRGSTPAAGERAFLLVHGFAQNRRAFSLGPMPEVLLQRGARVFLGELRGHGGSKAPDDHHWNMATHLELDCPALIEGVRARAGVERP